MRAGSSMLNSRTDWRADWRTDWRTDRQVPDPRGLPLAKVPATRDDIEQQVRVLVVELDAQR